MGEKKKNSTERVRQDGAGDRHLHASGPITPRWGTDGLSLFGEGLPRSRMNHGQTPSPAFLCASSI